MLEGWEELSSSIRKMESTWKPSKNAMKKMKIPMKAAVPCKVGTKKRCNKSRATDDETQGSIKIQKTKPRLHRGGTWIHETAVGSYSTKRSWRSHRRKIVQVDESLQFGAQVCSHASRRRKFLMQTAVDKEWKKLETIPAWQLDKVKSKKEVILQAQKDIRTVHFASLWIFVISKMRSWNRSIRSIDSGSCSEVTWWNTIQYLMLYLLKVRPASQMTAAKSHGCHCKTTWLCRTRQTKYPLTPK